MITSGTSVLVMLAVAFKRHHWWNATFTVIGLNLALISLYWVARQGEQSITTLLVSDGQSWFYSALILLSALACSTLTNAYIEGFGGNKEEVYLLLTIAAAGGLVMVSSNHLASFFIGLEILSVPLYGMIAYTFRFSHSLEAAVKYLILSAGASAFLLFGMALLYAQTGALSYQALSASISADAFSRDPLLMAGAAMILVGLGFKLSFAPFHLWTPDVYDGAPAPVGAFLASASKVAVFAALMRFLAETPIGSQAKIYSIFAVIAALSIIVGNLLALMQTNLKRLLGYSSIAHFGYLLVAVVASNNLSKEAITLYLVAYVLTSLGAFGVVTLMSSPFSGKDADHINDYRGLFWKRPYLTAVLTAMTLSLAGIPLTAGFMGKFFVMAAGVDAKLWWLLGTMILGSTIGIYYYLRVMVSMYLSIPNRQRLDAPHNWGFRAGGMMVLLIATAVVFIGVYPQPLLDLIHAAGLSVL